MAATGGLNTTSAFGRQLAVGVFGSARIQPQDARFVDAVEVGRTLAVGGFAVVTGGYGGLMAAVSRGAAEAGGHVVGLAMRAWDELQQNPWVTETRWSEDVFQRLKVFHACDVLLGLPGGLGTLAEVALAWASFSTDPHVTPPLVLYGAAWAELREHFRRALVVDEQDLALVRVVPSVDELIPALHAALDAKRSASRRLGGKG